MTSHIKLFAFVLAVLMSISCEKADRGEDENDGEFKLVTIYPTMGSSATTVTINGTGLRGSEIVRFNGIRATITGGTDRDLEVRVPNQECSGPVTIERDGEVIPFGVFKYLDVTVSTFIGEETDGFGEASMTSKDGLHGIAIDASDNIYINENHRILKITPAKVVSTFIGTKERDASFPSFAQIYYIARDGLGNFYATEPGSFGGMVTKITATGERDGLYNVEGAFGIATDVKNNVYVSGYSYIYKKNA